MTRWEKKNITIGERCVISDGAVIHPNTIIGDEVYIGPYAIIGAPPQHHGSYPAPLRGKHHHKGIEIGSGSCIREFVTVHGGIVEPTRIGEGALVMAYSHVAHDCQLGDGVTLSTNSILGGFTVIDDEVTFGQGVITHPWIIVGESAMVGLNSSVVKDVMPYQKVAGAPARLLGPNTHRYADAEWSEMGLGAETWERWGDLLARREKWRSEWSKHA